MGCTLNTIAYLGIDIQFARLTDEDRRRGLVFLYLYDLPYVDLTIYKGIIITNYVEEKFLFEHRDKLLQYLEQGGVVFSLAETSLPWTPSIGKWRRSPIPIREREIIIKEPLHPLFERIDAYDINYRKGVRGFFSRGYFEEIPKGVKVLVTDQSDVPIMYIDQNSTNGTIIAGAGTDIYRVYIDAENTSKKLSLQMLAFIREEHKRNKMKGAVRG